LSPVIYYLFIYLQVVREYWYVASFYNALDRENKELLEPINETKEKIGVVKSVGGFANALKQIASMKMMALRGKVLASKRFVDEATIILRELTLQKELSYQREYDEANKKSLKKDDSP
jgi:hypothetical protein